MRSSCLHMPLRALSLLVAPALIGTAAQAAAGNDAGATAADDQSFEKELDAIVVTGKQERFKVNVVQVGAFRNQSVLEVPLTIAVMPRALIDAQGMTGLDDAFRNTPSVSQQVTSPLLSNNFVVRGVLMQAVTNYRLNGSLPIINFSPIPLENKERVEILKGVSALYYGFTTPSAIANIVTKRASAKPVTAITLTGDAEGSYGGHVDIGRTFGAQGQFGIRINGAAGRIETPIDGIDGHRWVATGAFDWRVTDKLALKLDIESYRRVLNEIGSIRVPNVVGAVGGVGGTITLPAIPDPSNRYAALNAPYTTSATNVMLRSDYALSDRWSVRVDVGQAQNRRARAVTGIRLTDVATGAGRVTGDFKIEPKNRNRYVRSEISGHFDTGPIGHDLLFGYSFNRQLSKAREGRTMTAFDSNLFDPVTVDYASLSLGPVTLDTNTVTRTDQGIYVLDTARIGEKWVMIGGLRGVRYQSVDGGERLKVETVTPTVGLVYRVTPRVSLYGTYIEGLESSGVAPDEANNAGEVLDPSVSKQLEAGARFEAGGLMLSAAYFHIDRTLTYINADNIYVADGKAIHRGVEASVQGEVGRSISLLASAAYLDAKQKSTGEAALDGRRVINTPRYTASLFVEYRPPVLEGFAINGGAFYTGRRTTDVQERAWLPAYTTYSLGARQRLGTSGGRPLTLQVNVDNLTNKRYWSVGGSVLYVGLPRTARVSLKYEL